MSQTSLCPTAPPSRSSLATIDGITLKRDLSVTKKKRYSGGAFAYQHRLELAEGHIAYVVGLTLTELKQLTGAALPLQRLQLQIQTLQIESEQLQAQETQHLLQKRLHEIDTQLQPLYEAHEKQQTVMFACFDEVLAAKFVAQEWEDGGQIRRTTEFDFGNLEVKLQIIKLLCDRTRLQRIQISASKH